MLEQKGRKKTNKNIDTYDRLSFESFINCFTVQAKITTLSKMVLNLFREDIKDINEGD